MIGGQEQISRDFDRQIIHRFRGEESFKKYWDSALRYLQRFPLEILLSQKDFYEKVYLPLRDHVEKLLEE